MNDLRNAKKDRNNTCQFYESGQGTFGEEENEWGGGVIREGYMGIWSKSMMCSYKNTLKHVVLYSAHMLMKTQNAA